ncbi:MAG TPA: MFS transporter [Caulobacteraceae bacterium]|jgi:Na+/melibiose symporter-like transporter|nr:MFS transporter [Caulobacteraceae bacterium]
MVDSARRSNGILLAWAGPCLPYAAIGLPLAVYLPNYYSQILGLGLSAAGFAFVAVRMVDIFFDPIVGWSMDRTRNRWGPYRTWITLGTPILGAAIFMIFMARPGVTFHYLFVWLLVLYLGFSITTLAQLAWGAVLAPEYDQRSRLCAWWQGGNILGVLIALFIPILATNLFHASPAQGVQAMGWFIIAALPITLLINLRVVPEPRAPASAPHGGVGAYFALFKRKAVRKVLISDLLLGLAPGITGAVLFNFFEAVKGYDRTQSQMLIVPYFVAGLVAAPFWSWLATRIGKHRALMAASIIFAVLYCGIGFIPGGNFMITAAGMFVAGLPYAAGLLLTRAMMADIADEVQLQTGVDRMGLLFSLLSLTTKLGYAISIGCLPLLAQLGFSDKSGAHNSDQAILALQIVFIAVPTVLLATSSVVLRGYPLGPYRHAEIRAALEAREQSA